jgi:hypothetical protein
MLSARQQLTEIVASLREVIAPAISEPYPKAQAYMAAVILEFVARQIDERGDIEAEKNAAIRELFAELAGTPAIARDAEISRIVKQSPGESELNALVEHLYRARERIGEETFERVNRRIRKTLRQLLDQDLKVAREN